MKKVTLSLVKFAFSALFRPGYIIHYIPALIKPRKAFPPRRSSHGFTLIEMLMVIAVITILTVATSSSFASLGSSGALDKEASDLADLLAEARTYAMANSTYVYVGFSEVESAQKGSPGVGRIVVAIVAAKAGTRTYGNTPASLPSDGVVPVTRLQTFENLHIADAGALISGSMSDRPASSTLGFVDLGGTTSSVTFQWPLGGTPQYSFVKVIEFSPEGIARVQTGNSYNSTIPSYIELPLLPTHGSTLLAAATNEAALQIAGMTGAVETYRP